MDEHEAAYVSRLGEAVAIQSVSAWPAHRGEILRMMEWTSAWITKLGGAASLRPNPVVEEAHGDVMVPNPPILLGTFGSDPTKRTVCVYGHLDVQAGLFFSFFFLMFPCLHLSIGVSVSKPF